VGDVVEQKRNEVDDIRDNVCSNGLHFCSMSYLPHYMGGNGRVVIVKINPADVVSIPSDYNNAKGRCCKYVVVGEHTDPEKEYKEYTQSAVVGADGSEIDLDNEDECCNRCGEYLDECECEICPDCGDRPEHCNCDKPAVDQPKQGFFSKMFGRKPNGQKYHNVRDASGKFVKRG
jgi:hypothetical protein